MSHVSEHVRPPKKLRNISRRTSDTRVSRKSITMCRMQHGIARKPWHTNTLRLVTLALIAKETLVVATEIPPSPVIAAVDLLAHTVQKIILLLCGLEI
jgi:hypothetical protein